MIYAEMKGKLPSLYYSEDILTSNTIGLLGLLSDNLFLKFLSEAVNLEGKTLKEIKEYSKIEKLEFWEYTDFGEPDVKILLTDAEKKKRAVVIIEAKFKAGKSGTAKTDGNGNIIGISEDQLARYWKYMETEYKEDDKFLIFLTADRSIPRDDITMSIKATGWKGKIYWINWYKINRLTMDILKMGVKNEIEEKILKLLNEYLNYKSFIMFEGWKDFGNKEYGKLLYHRLYNLNVNNADYETLCYKRLYQLVYLYPTRKFNKFYSGGNNE